MAEDEAGRMNPLHTVRATVKFFVDYMEITTIEEFRDMKSRAGVLLHELQRNFPSTGGDMEVDEDLENSIVDDADIPKIEQFKTVLRRMFSKEIEIRSKLEKDVHYTETSWGDGSLNFRGDGRLSPCPIPSAYKTHPSFMGGRRQPGANFIFQMKLGDEDDVDVFHFRSGIILRVDDHKEFRDVIDDVIQKLVKGTSIESSEVEVLRGKLHQLLRKMFFPGDSILSFFEFDVSIRDIVKLTQFHSKKWAAAYEYFATSWNRSADKLGRTIKNLRWDDEITTCRGLEKRSDFELNFGISKIRRQLERRIVKGGLVNGYEENWIRDVFLKQSSRIELESVVSEVENFKPLDFNNIFDEGIEYPVVVRSRKTRGNPEENELVLPDTSRESTVETGSNEIVDPKSCLLIPGVVESETQEPAPTKTTKDLEWCLLPKRIERRSSRKRLVRDVVQQPQKGPKDLPCNKRAKLSLLGSAVRALPSRSRVAPRKIVESPVFVNSLITNSRSDNSKAHDSNKNTKSTGRCGTLKKTDFSEKKSTRSVALQNQSRDRSQTRSTTKLAAAAVEVESNLVPCSVMLETSKDTGGVGDPELVEEPVVVHRKILEKSKETDTNKLKTCTPTQPTQETQLTALSTNTSDPKCNEERSRIVLESSNPDEVDEDPRKCRVQNLGNPNISTTAPKSRKKKKETSLAAVVNEKIDVSHSPNQPKSSTPIPTVSETQPTKTSRITSPNSARLTFQQRLEQRVQQKIKERGKGMEDRARARFAKLSFHSSGSESD